MDWPTSDRVASLPRVARGRRTRRAARRGQVTLAVTSVGTVLAIALPQIVEALTSGRLQLPDALEPWRVLLIIVLSSLAAALVEYRAGGEAGAVRVVDGAGARGRVGGGGDDAA